MRRYHITYGALTTVGGQVISASGNGSIDDKRVVVEGDIITCPACKSTGYVLCIGPRIPEFWGEGVGKPVALENDLCICKCSNPPRLIANQSLRAQTIEGVAEMGAGNFSPPALDTSAASKVMSQTGDYDEFFIVRDEDGAPIPNYAYRIKAIDGGILEGVTDEAGRTSLAATGESAAYLDVSLTRPAEVEHAK